MRVRYCVYLVSPFLLLAPPRQVTARIGNSLFALYENVPPLRVYTGMQQSFGTRLHYIARKFIGRVGDHRDRLA